jgi:hypothetical protein
MEGNIKMDIREGEDAEWIQLAHDRVEGLDLVNTVINILVL